MQIRGAIMNEINPHRNGMWNKKLSRTDAQQPTAGSRMTFLRLTRSGHKIDKRDFFRERFFGNLDWRRADIHGMKGVAYAYANIAVVIMGEWRGMRKMLVTHSRKRMTRNSEAPTWLHYDKATISDLVERDVSGEDVRLSIGPDGTYMLAIESVVNL